MKNNRAATTIILTGILAPLILVTLVGIAVMKNAHASTLQSCCTNTTPIVQVNKNDCKNNCAPQAVNPKVS